jgi:hypothetical protein
MDSPLFLKLIEENPILYPIIKTGSYNDLDLSNIKHNKLFHGAIEFFSFPLSEEEVFNNVTVGFTEIGADVSFMTKDSKYFDNPLPYFRRDSPVGSASSITIGNRTASTIKKRLGKFDAFAPPYDTVSVAIMKSTVYGYNIHLIYSERK